MRTCSNCGQKEAQIQTRGTILCMDCILFAFRQIVRRSWFQLKQKHRKSLFRPR